VPNILSSLNDLQVGERKGDKHYKEFQFIAHCSFYFKNCSGKTFGNFLRGIFEKENMIIHRNPQPIRLLHLQTGSKNVYSSSLLVQ